MDGTTKLFIFMLIVSLIFGTIVLVTHPNYRVKNVYQTNKNFYPQVNENSVTQELKELFYVKR
jgi:hypothetical protein